jgi:hypothetical protein
MNKMVLFITEDFFLATLIIPVMLVQHFVCSVRYNQTPESGSPGVAVPRL